MIVTILLCLSFAHDPGQALAIGDRIRMFRPKCFLNKSESLLPKGLGMPMVSPFIREPCQQVEGVGDEGVPRLQDTFTGCQRLLQQLLGLLILALLYIELRQVDGGHQGVGMFGAGRLLADTERLLQEWLGLFILALGAVEHAQIIEAESSRGMVRSERLFADGKGLLVQPLRLLVVALDTSEYRQGVETFGDSRMFGPEHLLSNGQGELVEGL